MPLPQSTLQHLRTFWKTHRHPTFLFPGKGHSGQGAATATEPMDRSTLQRAFRLPLKASGIKKAVLHLVPPLLPNPPRMDSEMMPGKRSAWCDLTNPSMLDQFWELVKDADVWVNSCLNLDSKGISPPQLAAVKAGLVSVHIAESMQLTESESTA